MATELHSPPSTASEAGIELVRRRGRVGSPSIPLGQGRHTLGSDPACDIHVEADGVLPQHALLIVGSHKTIVKALSPLTWINDGPFSEATLRPGDRLIVGPVEYSVRKTSGGTESFPSGLEVRAPEPVRGAFVPPPLPHSHAEAVSLLPGVANLLAFEDDSVIDFPAPQRLEERHAVVKPGRPIAPPPLPPRPEIAVSFPSAAVKAESEREVEAVREERKRHEAALSEAIRDRDAIAKTLQDVLAERDRARDQAAALEIAQSEARALRTALLAAEQKLQEAEGERQELLGLKTQTAELQATISTLSQRSVPQRSIMLDADRAALLQQRTELLTLRREVQEKLNEQHRMSLDLDDARQALQKDAEEASLRHLAVEEELARVEHLVQSLNEQRADLEQRERELRESQTRVSELDADLQVRLQSIAHAEESATARTRAVEAAEAEARELIGRAEEIRRDDEQVRVRREELDRLAAHIEEELLRIEQAGQARADLQAELDRRFETIVQREQSFSVERQAVASKMAEIESREVAVREREERQAADRKGLDQELAAHSKRVQTDAVTRSELETFAQQLQERTDALRFAEERLLADEQAIVARVSEYDRNRDQEWNLEEARLNAESLAQRERELDGKFEALSIREESLERRDAEMRDRERHLVDREESVERQQGAMHDTPTANPVPDAEWIKLDEKIAMLTTQERDIARIQIELADHRAEFLSRYEELERERDRFDVDRRRLDEELDRLERDRQRFQDELTFHADAGRRDEIRDEAVPPPMPDIASASLHWDEPAPETPDVGDDRYRGEPRSGRASEPQSSADFQSPLSRLMRETSFPDASADAETPGRVAETDLGTALLEEEYQDDPATDVDDESVEQSQDALELRAHLADLFGIDLSHRNAPELVDEPQEEEAPVEPLPLKPSARPEASVVAPPEPVAPSSPAPADDDVASYMERLLARTRRAAPATAETVVTPPPVAMAVAPEPTPAAEPAEDSDEVAEAARPQRRPLQREEREAIRGSLDSFRELANRTARAAVARHQLVKLRQSRSTKAMLATFCAVVSVVLVLPEAWGNDRYRHFAVGCLSITIIAALEWLRTKVRIQKLDEFVADAEVAQDPLEEDREPTEESSPSEDV